FPQALGAPCVGSPAAQTNSSGATPHDEQSQDTDHIGGGCHYAAAEPPPLPPLGAPSQTETLPAAQLTITPESSTVATVVPSTGLPPIIRPSASHEVAHTGVSSTASSVVKAPSVTRSNHGRPSPSG